MTATEPIEPVETPETEVEEARAFTLPEDFATTVQGWDIPVETLPEAVQLYKTLQTEEGVIDGFIQLGQSLGFGIKELERLFAEDPAGAAAAVQAAAPAAPEVDPDHLPTYAEIQELIQAERARVDQTFQQQQTAEQQRREAHTFAAIDKWFNEHGIDQNDKVARAAVAAFAQQTLLPGQDDYDPNVVLPALERGLSSYEADIEARAQSLLSRKAAAAKSQPTALGSGGGAVTTDDGEVDAPNYHELRSAALQTAKDRVRAKLRAAGAEL